MNKPVYQTKDQKYKGYLIGILATGFIVGNLISTLDQLL
jgi:hypothetical protein